MRRIRLRDFRSYAALDVTFEGSLVALTGENGAGKTNLIEALSLFSPGRGLRRAELAEFPRIGGQGGFAIAVDVEDEGERRLFGVGVETNSAGAMERVARIDRAPASSTREFSNHLRFVWLTPTMDGLFIGPPSERRRFLDRLVLSVDPHHSSRYGQFERALRGRNRLLEEGGRNSAWLDALEREAAELAVAIAAARLECVARLDAAIAAERDDSYPFPWGEVSLQGDVEALARERPAIEAEQAYRQTLRENRARDAAAARTLIGPHVSDLVVRHGPKSAPASQCSTGEQKALLVGLVLAHARLVADMSGIAPLALLDEVAAHFDPRRRAALFEALTRIGGQVFVTGADPQAFAGLHADVYDVAGGRVIRNTNQA